MTEKQLQGPNRFLSDGLASAKECKSLVEIAKTFAILGDGYQGKKSPHTLMEKFEGVTLGRVVLLVYIGLLNRKYLEMYLNLTENVRHEVQSHFKLNQTLHFSYTHLVCRSALPDSPKNRTDLSHAVHADNCNILPDGECDKSPPAFTWRDYSAILYLNNDFDGGEFIFSEDPKGKTIQSMVSPSCGKLLGFSSGGENLHGVRAVKRGSRCAIGMWFTFDEGHIEKDRPVAYRLLNNTKT